MTPGQLPVEVDRLRLALRDACLFRSAVMRRFTNEFPRPIYFTDDLRKLDEKAADSLANVVLDKHFEDRNWRKGKLIPCSPNN